MRHALVEVFNERSASHTEQIQLQQQSSTPILSAHFTHRLVFEKYSETIIYSNIDLFDMFQSLLIRSSSWSFSIAVSVRKDVRQHDKQSFFHTMSWIKNVSPRAGLTTMLAVPWEEPPYPSSPPGPRSTANFFNCTLFRRYRLNVTTTQKVVNFFFWGGGRKVHPR